MFDSFAEFYYTPATPFDFTANRYKEIFPKADFSTARDNSWGGVAKTLLFAVEEDKGSWALSIRAADRPFTIMCVRIKARNDDPTRFPAHFPHSEFGETYRCLAMAHEIGHITGQVDDYMQKISLISGKSVIAPTFGQFGQTSTGDDINSDNSNFPSKTSGSDAPSIFYDGNTMMDKNGPYRMRHIWRFVYWLNTESAPGKLLNTFLNDTKFHIVYPRFEATFAKQLLYFRDSAIKENTWEIAASGTLTFVADRPINVYLFKKLGETELKDKTDITKDRYQAVVVARLLLSVFFDENICRC